jgi:NADH dehydrogenase (ubiquinone) 1 beta subcomplex subunit 9
MFVQALFQEAEDLLEKWKHPDPYHAPTAPGGSLSRPLPDGIAVADPALQYRIEVRAQSSSTNPRP